MNEDNTDRRPGNQALAAMAANMNSAPMRGYTPQKAHHFLSIEKPIPRTTLSL